MVRVADEDDLLELLDELEAEEAAEASVQIPTEQITAGTQFKIQLPTKLSSAQETLRTKPPSVRETLRGRLEETGWEVDLDEPRMRRGALDFEVAPELNERWGTQQLHRKLKDPQVDRLRGPQIRAARPALASLSTNRLDDDVAAKVARTKAAGAKGAGTKSHHPSRAYEKAVCLAHGANAPSLCGGSSSPNKGINSSYIDDDPWSGEGVGGEVHESARLVQSLLQRSAMRQSESVLREEEELRRMEAIRDEYKLHELEARADGVEDRVG